MLAQLIKFALTGLVNTCIDFGIFNLLIFLTGAQSFLSIGLINTLAVSTAMCNSFILNRSWTFSANSSKGQMQRFIIASAIGIIINSSTVVLISDLATGTAFSPYLLLNIAKILGALLSTSWNFLAYRNWVFAVHRSKLIFQEKGFVPGMISIVIPAYNEEQRLPQRLHQLATSLPDHFPLEILVVDDGSKDHTPDIIWDAAKQYSFVKYLKHKLNQGKGAAVRTGMLNATGEHLIFTDADNTYTSEHIIMVADKLLQGNKVVIACRKGLRGERLQGESFWRSWQGKIYNVLVQILLLPGINDSQCGLKGFNREVAAQIFPRQRIKGFAFDVELLALLRAVQIPITELAVTGKDCSGSTIHHLLTPLAMAWDTLKIKWALLFNLYDLPGMISFPKRWALAGSLFVLAFLIRIPWLWEVPRYIDELKEVKLAYQIYLGQALPLHNMAHDIGALHNYILAGIFKIMGASIYLPRLYVAVTSALTVVLLYYIAKKMFGQWVGITAALLLAGNGMHILVTHMSWSNCTTPFFFCLAFLALLKTEEKRSGFWLIITAFLWALTLQTHSSVIIYVLAVIIYILRPDFRHKTAIRTSYYWGAALSFILAYSNMVYYNIISRGGSISWLKYKDYALEKEPGVISYLYNLQEMLVQLLRSVSSTYTNQDNWWHYLSYPWFAITLLLLVMGIYLAYKGKKYLPLYFLAVSILIMPWINHRYEFFLPTRYIMPVVLCALILIAVAIIRIFTCLYVFYGRKHSIVIPAFSALLLLVVLEVIPFYDYCAQKAGTNQSNRLALQIFDKAMELSDNRSTLVILDKNITLENDPLPYLLTLAKQPYMISNAEILATAQSIPPNYKNKKLVGIVSASNFKALRPQLDPQEIDSYSCKLIMPSSARGERKVYVLDLGYMQKQ